MYDSPSEYTNEDRREYRELTEKLQRLEEENAYCVQLTDGREFSTSAEILADYLYLKNEVEALRQQLTTANAMCAEIAKAFKLMQEAYLLAEDFVGIECVTSEESEEINMAYEKALATYERSKSL